MQLKLADYGEKKEKFERFLELGRAINKFVYCGDLIEIITQKEGQEYAHCHSYIKDDKDPLNRFSGLFDGRTYGDGRFVLIRGIELETGLIYWGDEFFSADGETLLSYCDDREILKSQAAVAFLEKALLGINIHQNPELYEKIR